MEGETEQFSGADRGERESSRHLIVGFQSIKLIGPTMKTTAG